MIRRRGTGSESNRNRGHTNSDRPSAQFHENLQTLGSVPPRAQRANSIEGQTASGKDKERLSQY
jgi:hypothetical protein